MGSNSKGDRTDSLRPGVVGDGLVEIGQPEQPLAAASEHLDLEWSGRSSGLLQLWHIETATVELRSGGTEKLLRLVDHRSRYMISAEV
jgi:hypothetical protein